MRSWDGLVWTDDSDHGRLRDFAIQTVQALLAATDVVPIPAAVLAAAVASDPDTSVEKHEAVFRKKMRAALKRWENARSLRAMIEMAETRRPFLAEVTAFDQDPWLVTVANGVLDLRTAKLAPANAELKLTRALPVAYDPTATCQRFRRFLAELFPLDTDEVVAFMQRFIGLCLTARTTEHILPIWWGEGSNGKSTLLKVVQAMLGPFAQVAPLSLLLDTGRGGHIPNDVARLLNTRLVVCSETPENGRLAEATIKALTGGDKLTRRFLHKEFFDFEPTHKVVLVTNHRPIVRGQEHALWRRLALVPFTTKFWKVDDPSRPDGALIEDKHLIDALLTELPGVLRWGVEGCLAWQREGLLLPKIMRVATADYRAEQDVLGPFIEERCTIDATAWTAANDLYSAYTDFIAAAHDKPMTTTAFGRALVARGYRAKKSAGVRGWGGIALGVRS